MLLPKLAVPTQTRRVTKNFLGLERRESPSDGQFADMTNLTSLRAPVLSPRKRRGVCHNIYSPQALCAKDALAWVDGSKLVYNSIEYDMGLSTEAADCPKQLISMGAYIVIFPDKKYFNTADMSDMGSIEAEFTTTEGNIVTFQLSGEDGSQYTVNYTSETAPETVQDGDCWLDTSDTYSVLKKYSSASASWVVVTTVYVKIIYTGIGTNFFEGDGVSLSGITATGIESLNGYNCIYSRGDGYIVISGVMPSAALEQTTSLTVARKCPDMDYVCESGNRLWGCRYGITDGRAVNELYASKLGDFKNWHCYRGISTDSWVSGVGSDGVFTAAVAYRGSPLFFKEDCLHKIYISSEGAHQVQTVNCRGVKRGCAESAKTADEMLIYLSPSGVCAYDGSLPVSIGEPLGGTYSEAAAGVLGSRYYISMKEGNAWSMYVYDCARGVWHREDSVHAEFFAQKDGELYFIDSDDRLISVNGIEGTLEEAVSWEAVSGVFGYGDPDKKYLSRFGFGMYLPNGSSMSAYIRYDSKGEWELVGSVYGGGTGTFNLPVIPRRCDHLQLKLKGTGEFKLYSFSRILESGSDENCR